MSKIFKIVLAVLLSLMFAVSAVAEDKISVLLNGKPLEFEVDPKIIIGTTMISVRSIFEAMGFQLFWDQNQETVTGILGKNVINLKIGDNTAYKNNSPHELKTPPVIQDGYTLAPLRFIAESADAVVNWNDTNKTVEIFTSDLNLSENSGDKLKNSVVMIDTDKHQGSGVIISSDGYIVTNFHIIEDSSTALFKFNDETYYMGKTTVRAYDKANDLAVLKIDKTGLEPALLGDSDSILIGDEVTAVGSPKGEFNVVSRGIVTALNKYTIGATAAIEKGSSGGALFNKNGELIGITSLYDTAGNNMSIPINKVKQMDFSQNIPLIELSSIEHTISCPDNFSYYIDGTKAVFSWPRVYGADYYKIYSSYTENGEFRPVANPVTNSYNWNWSFPYCMKIDLRDFNKIYFKISSVSNGIESPLSRAYKVEIQ